MSFDVYRINKASEKLSKMRPKPLSRQPILQRYYPDVTYDGKWVKATEVVADVLAQVVEEWKAKKTSDVMVSQHEITLAAISTMTDYLLSDHTTSEGILRNIFMLEAIKGMPITIYRVEVDEIRGERSRHQKQWLAIRKESANIGIVSNKGADYQYTIGYGGDYKAIESDYGGSNPSIGLTLYSFNIRNYWVFLPEGATDFYGIVNHTNNTLFEGGW